MAKTTDKNNKEEPIEKQLWKAADKLRKNIDAAEYKHIVLGLIFLKYISDAFEELHTKLKSGKGEYAGADPEDKDEYKAENVFFVPEKARWSYLQSKAKLPVIGKEVDNAMDAIEKDNPSLKDVLPKVFARGNLDPTSLWFLNRNKPAARRDEVLFIDARNLGFLINRRTKELSKEDIQQIAATYHNWCKGTIHRAPTAQYEDIKGFCNSASIERIHELDYVLTPGRYGDFLMTKMISISKKDSPRYKKNLKNN